MAEKKLDIKLGAKDEASKVVKGLADRLRDLKKAGDSRGITGDAGILGLLKGGGVAIAATFAADALKRIADVTKEIKTGGLSASEAILKFGEAIPVLDRIFQAGQAIRNVFDDTADAIKRITNDTKSHDAFNSFLEKSRQSRQDRQEESDNALRNIGQKRELIGASDGKKAFLDVKHKVINKIFGKEADRKRAQKEIKDRALKELEFQQERLREARNDVPAAQVSSGGPSGEGAGRVTNQREIDNASNAVRLIEDRIDRIRRSRDRELGELNANKDEEIRQQIFLARDRLIGEVAPAFAKQFIGSVGEAIKSNFVGAGANQRGLDLKTEFTIDLIKKSRVFDDFFTRSGLRGLFRNDSSRAAKRDARNVSPDGSASLLESRSIAGVRGPQGGDRLANIEKHTSETAKGLKKLEGFFLEIVRGLVGQPKIIIEKAK